MNATGHPPNGGGPGGPPVHLVLLTGLSGSGKSSVAKSFEDMGYYVVDNLPVPLLETFLPDPGRHVEGADRIAVVTDVRAPGFADRLPKILRELDPKPTLLFLEASDETLVRRFSETRRPHPLAADRQPIDGIRQEREMLADLRALADLVLDTSETSIHEIRGQIYREFSREAGRTPEMRVSLVSFGFKYGIPYGTDLLFDVRFLPNPYFVAGLREQTGLDAGVQDFLTEEDDFREIRDRLADLLLYLLPRYQHENRSYLSVAIGCTGGRHRSVALCEALAERLGKESWGTRVVHRDIER